MAISKTKINQRMNKKTNSVLVEAIYLAKKNNLLDLAGAIAVSSRQQAAVNVGRLNEVKGDSVIIPGKILNMGEVKKKLKVYSLSISESALEKLKKAGCTYESIHSALKKGEKIKGEIIK